MRSLGVPKVPNHQYHPTKREMTYRTRRLRRFISGLSGGDVVVSGAISGLVRHVHEVVIRANSMSGGTTIDTAFPLVRIAVRNSGGTYTVLDRVRLSQGLATRTSAAGFFWSGTDVLLSRTTVAMEAKLGSGDPEEDYYQLEAGEQLMAEVVDMTDAVVAGASGFMSVATKFSDQ